MLLSQNTGLSVNESSSNFIPDDVYPTKEEIQLNYDSELKWRAAISRGDSKSAKKAFLEMASNDFLYRTPANPFRTIKNILLSVNALCRAAAIDGGASAISVHQTHEAYAILIESASNTMDLEKIERRIFDAYCNLVIDSHTKNYSPVVANAIQYLYNYYELPLSLKTVAKEIHCSEGHLSRIFQKETGKTLGAYLNELRIEQSISLLKLHPENITDVALSVGFSSYTKFSIEFKKYTGKCATDYLKSHTD